MKSLLKTYGERRNIILTGFMGTGKSAVGKIVAKKLGLEFVDIDNLIESRSGVKISEIFDKEGEKKFREMESEVILDICGKSGQVISTGGGAITIDGNLDIMRGAGPVVALTASIDVIYDRVRDEIHRPLLNSADPTNSIKKLLKEREHHYLKADLTLDTTGKSPGKVADEMLSKIGIDYDSPSVL